MFVVDRELITELAMLIASSLGIVVEFTDKRSSRPSVELLVSTVWLRPLDDEKATDELELIELAVVALVDPRVEDVVELVEFRTPLETTPRPTTIRIATTTMATILEEIALAPSVVIFHLAKGSGAISDYASAALLSGTYPSFCAMTPVSPAASILLLDSSTAWGTVLDHQPLSAILFL